VETLVGAEKKVEENYASCGVKMLAGLEFYCDCPLVFLTACHLQESLFKELGWIPLTPEIK
jgi:hypothetical protein